MVFSVPVSIISDIHEVVKLRNISFFYIINFRSMYGVVISYDCWIVYFPSACREYMLVAFVPVSLNNLMSQSARYMIR